VTIQALVIGIGSGNPDHLTREAVAALNRVDAFLVADKGAAKHDLAQLREDLCRELITHDHYSLVEVPDPERGSDRERDAEDYRAGVAAWHDARAQRYAETITAELPDGGTVGFLIWGDPAFYDSTIRIVESIRNLGIDLELSVIPGISSIQLLACSGLVERFGDLMIYWGAQLGLPDEALVSGLLSEVIDEIRATRAGVRTARGWVMDTYLLRPPS
jgi:precorrin-6A synthase